MSHELNPGDYIHASDITDEAMFDALQKAGGGDQDYARWNHREPLFVLVYDSDHDWVWVTAEDELCERRIHPSDVLSTKHEARSTGRKPRISDYIAKEHITNPEVLDALVKAASGTPDHCPWEDRHRWTGIVLDNDHDWVWCDGNYQTPRLTITPDVILGTKHEARSTEPDATFTDAASFLHHFARELSSFDWDARSASQCYIDSTTGEPITSIEDAVEDLGKGDEVEYHYPRVWVEGYIERNAIDLARTIHRDSPQTSNPGIITAALLSLVPGDK